MNSAPKFYTIYHLINSNVVAFTILTAVLSFDLVLDGFLCVVVSQWQLISFHPEWIRLNGVFISTARLSSVPLVKKGLFAIRIKKTHTKEGFAETVIGKYANFIV